MQKKTGGKKLSRWLARAWRAVTAGWVSGQAEFQIQVERDRETKCSIWESLTLSRSAVSWLQQLSTDPQSSVLQDHANQKTASLRRPSVVMLTACERKNQNTPWDIHTHTEIVCHCGNPSEENSSPFPSVKPPSLSGRVNSFICPFPHTVPKSACWSMWGSPT